MALGDRHEAPRGRMLSGLTNAVSRGIHISDPYPYPLESSNVTDERDPGDLLSAHLSTRLPMKPLLSGGNQLWAVPTLTE